MSTPAAFSERERIPLLRRPLPFVIVGAAHLIGRLPPMRIRQVLTVLSRRARPATYDEASAARRDVVAVSVRCAGQGCLPRSIAAALLCRARGTWPTWRTGVRTVPLLAHAWIEAEGRPVTEPPGTGRIHPLITIAPGPAGHHVR